MSYLFVKNKLKQLMNNKPVLIVGLIVVFHCIINYIWLKHDTFPLWYDYGGYFKRSIEIFYASQNSLSDFLNALLGIGGYQNTYNPYRVFLPFSSVFWYYLFGLSADVAVMSCSFFLALCLFSVYGISSKIFGKQTGVLAAFLLSTSPGFFIYFRRYSPEFAVTGLIALAAYCLFSSGNFSNRRYSILFGITFALAILTKKMAFGFMAGLLLYTFLKIDYSSKEILKCTAINFAFSASIAVGIILPVYLQHFKTIIGHIFEVVYSDNIRNFYNMPFILSWEGVLFYIKDLWKFSFSPIYFIFFTIGVFFSAIKRIPKRGFLFLFFIGGYLILSSMQVKAQYYGMPFLIPCSIFAAYGIEKLTKNRVIKFMLVFVVIIFGILQLFYYSFPVFEGIIPSVGRKIEFKKYYFPVKENWRLNEAIDYIQENNEFVNRIIRIHVGANLYAFSPMTLGYTAAFKKAKFKFGSYIIPEQEVLNSFDFVMIKSGHNRGSFTLLNRNRS